MWPRSVAKDGVSLLETLIALFVLVSAFTILLTLFLRSTDYQVNVEKKVMSVAFGEAVLDDIKAWASDYDNYAGDWSTWNKVTLPEYTGFEASASLRQPQVPNPCSLLELGKPVAKQTLMKESFRDVTLEVTHQGSKQLSLTTRIAEPMRDIKEIRVEEVAGGTTLGPNAEATFQATMYDSHDRPVSDLVFRWSIEPITGNGSVTAQIPDSSLAKARHAFIGADGKTQIVPGSCRVVAYAQYRARPYFGQFEPLELLP